MELWQLDIMEARLVDGSALKVLTGLDDHSRFYVLARALPRATARPVCEAFADALRRYGIPEAVLTDNGRVFTGPRPHEKGRGPVDRICRENGIRHMLTAVRSPTTTGKVERLHRTLRDELFSIRAFSDIEEAQRALDGYVAAYNALRPHQALGMAVPVERFSLAGPRRRRSPPSFASDGVPDDWGHPREPRWSPRARVDSRWRVAKTRFAGKRGEGQRQ